MSCADVMYQPYSPYFPYHQRAQSQPQQDYRKFSFLKPHTATSPASLDPTSPASSIGSPDCQQTQDSSKQEAKGEAQYLSANCVLFTYYSGDISTVVDEHFARALSQQSSYAPTPDPASAKQQKGPPMSHRNFPPSFWNSHYQSGMSTIGAPPHLPDHLTTSYAGPPDPYHSGNLLHHHQNDPWAHYALGGQPAAPGHHYAHSYHHPGMSGAHGSRFTPQYGSFLLQPSMRPSGRIGPPSASATCASLEKSAESWGTSRYHDSLLDSNYGAAAAYSAMTGLEAQHQDSKDLYWF